MIVADLTEAALIARIRDRLPAAPSWLLVGPGDDAAVVEPERNRVEVFTVDALVESVHFDRAFVPPAAIGHRALAVNLSDIAAMGATPRLALLSLVLPPPLPLDDFDGIVDGFVALAAVHRVVVAGGNITRSPGPLMIDVSVMGTVKRRQVLTRSGARPGHELYVTGTIGAAAAGLEVLRAQGASAAGESPLVSSYRYPSPRLRMGTLISRNRAASACMDLSDGLADALLQVAAASGVGAVVDAGALPIHPEARSWFEARGVDPVQAAVAGGDDYELLVSVAPRTRRRLAAAERHGDVPLTRIGVCTPEGAVRLRRTDGNTVSEEPVAGPAFRHFR
ncbi:MAG: thiamine-phosphate kinase [Betaproteobacteria bacterium]